MQVNLVGHPDAVADVELWLARHGETEWSLSGQHTGTTDIPLTDRGRDAARALGEKLRGETFDLVLTSPLARARDTATLAGFGDGAVITPDLAEWNYGEYEGLTTEQIRERAPGWTVFADGCPGGEVAEQVGARVDRVIETVRALGGGRAIAFSHGHLLRVLGARWVGLGAADGSRFFLETATVSILGYDRETAVIQQWNAS
jgi:broad specificity phosphatase PhoE